MFWALLLSIAAWPLLFIVGSRTGYKLGLMDMKSWWEAASKRREKRRKDLVVVPSDVSEESVEEFLATLDVLEID